MAYIRSEQEAELKIEEMKRKTKGKYITQGVTFNKDSERQMQLLKYALMTASTFSGLGKELLAERIENKVKQKSIPTPAQYERDIKRNAVKFFID